jgi:hypothetical protein
MVNGESINRVTACPDEVGVRLRRQGNRGMVM